MNQRETIQYVVHISRNLRQKHLERDTVYVLLRWRGSRGVRHVVAGTTEMDVGHPQKEMHCWQKPHDVDECCPLSVR